MARGCVAVPCHNDPVSMDLILGSFNRRIGSEESIRCSKNRADITDQGIVAAIYQVLASLDDILLTFDLRVLVPHNYRVGSFNGIPVTKHRNIQPINRVLLPSNDVSVTSSNIPTAEYQRSVILASKSVLGNSLFIDLPEQAIPELVDIVRQKLVGSSKRLIPHQGRHPSPNPYQIEWNVLKIRNPRLYHLKRSSWDAVGALIVGCRADTVVALGDGSGLGCPDVKEE